MKQSLLILLIACLATSCASSYVPRANTRDEVQRYVERAAQLVASRGADAACRDFNRAAWKAGDYYIFVTNAETAVTVCHPARPDRVGRNEYDLQDASGKYFMREMLAVVKEQPGEGWVHYMWARPGETTPAPKTAFVVGVTSPDGTRFLIGSGGYSIAP
jgi:methyl-accepting chemotaxis protein